MTLWLRFRPNYSALFALYPSGGPPQYTTTTVAHLHNTPELIEPEIFFHIESMEAVLSWMIGHMGTLHCMLLHCMHFQVSVLIELHFKQFTLNGCLLLWVIKCFARVPFEERTLLQTQGWIKMWYICRFSVSYSLWNYCFTFIPSVGWLRGFKVSRFCSFIDSIFFKLFISNYV